jgi:hypothetical protein
MPAALPGGVSPDLPAEAMELGQKLTDPAAAAKHWRRA